LLAGVLAATFLASACGSTKPSEPAVTADTWAVVDGRPISKDTTEKAFRRTRDPNETLSAEEATAAKLTVLEDLILQDLLVTKATALKVEVPAAELDTAFTNARGGLNDEQFKQELTRRTLTEADVREGLRRQLLAEKVIEQEVSKQVTIGDPDVTRFFEANRAQFNLTEESYHIAQIVITPQRDAQITNTTGDDAATPQQAAAKARSIMERLKAGTSFRELATSYSEDPTSAQRGGDMGLIPVSRLQQAPPPLRNAVLNKTAGTVNVASAGNGAFTIVLVVAREAAGQRDLSTPGLKEQITTTLKTRKEGLLRAAYLTTLRTDATVVNHLARRVVQAKGAPPTT
ncbi:MAG: peptidylprolyl isomerase, partial [Vicinamibacteraceae bacterium]